MTTAFAATVYIGRFQPFHLGHLAMLRAALALAPLCVVVLGSAHGGRSPKNPFTYDERVTMLQQALTADESARVLTLPMRDYYNETRWAQAVFREVSALLATHGVRSANHVALVGHFKDNSSSYLKNFPAWQLQALPRQNAIDAAPFRSKLLLATNLSEASAVVSSAANLLPSSTMDFLHRWLSTPHFAALHLEAEALQAHHARWAVAPYPPVFVTVDALVLCQQHVLLIRRGRAPGKGRYALPGGYLDQQESTYRGALRELHEETRLPITAALEAGLRGQHVFEHPARSLLGRVITHVSFFELAAEALPPVRGADDATSAEWIPVAQLLALEDQLHDDHFMVLDHFLGILPG